MNCSTLATIVAAVVCLGAGVPAYAQESKPAAPAPQAPRKFVPPVRGVAEVGILRPVTKYDAKTKEVVSTIKVKNLSTGSIAGLRIDEFWYDKAGNMLPGDSKRMRQPLLPGEVVTIELRTPRDPKMDRNNFQFSHANGQIKTKTLTKME